MILVMVGKREIGLTSVVVGLLGTGFIMVWLSEEGITPVESMWFMSLRIC
jgi:hypothetical protein